MLIKVSGRGQVCLPSAYRQRVDIRTGDYLEALEKGDNLVLYPNKNNLNKDELNALLDRTAGSWKQMDLDGASFVRLLRQGSSRDVW
jgi:AbrB family looped-hinge helix DNA binding protein